MMLYRFTKRLVDVLVAGFALILLSPIWLATAAAIRICLGRPVYFRQTRIGLREAPFRIWKFRTMTDQRGADGTLLPDHVRLTAPGRFLRDMSLDEIPQLINVLRGQMSLVGPRPLLPKYLPLYSEFQRRRHEVKPGITGWAQVNGRNAVAWARRFEMDVWYVDHRCLILDLMILWRTLSRVVRRTGISGEGSVTMPEFAGSAGQERGR
jgi:sugar transferase EpsL